MNKHGAVWVVALAAGLTLGIMLLPPIAQDPLYHNFADQRTFLGIHNAMNVLSNLPFALVGILGLCVVASWQSLSSARVIYIILFAAIGLTAFGSAYYHLHPTSETLFWDRLPMSIGFAAFFAALVAERWDFNLGKVLLWPLVAFAAWSVWYWQHGEKMGQGDLRPYVLVQYGGLILTLAVLVFFKSRYLRNSYILAALLLYGLAKVFEWADFGVYRLLGLISGHSLKHLSAALGCYCLVKVAKGATK